MKKHCLSLLLALALLWSLTACGGSASSLSAVSSAGESETSAETSTESSAETESNPESEEPASDVEMSEAASSETSAAAEPTTVDPSDIDASALYPIYDEAVTFSAFLDIAPWGSAYIGEGKAFENSRAILAAEEATGVHLEVDWSDPDTYFEKMNLLLAGGDYPALLRDPSGEYSGGIDGLIADDICEDLYPYFAEYAPNYYAVLERDSSFKTNVTSSTGQAVAMYSYTEIPLYTRGMFVRMDMLESVGVSEIPATYDALYDAAIALKNGTNAAPIVSPNILRYGYAAGDLGNSNSAAADLDWWNIDGTITAAVTLDSEYEYIALMRQWNEEGLFLDDWYNPAPFYDNEFLTDQIVFANAAYTMASEAQKLSAANPDTFEAYPMANVVVSEGDTIKTIDNSWGGVGDGKFCVTTGCDDIPAMVSYINWFFTADGILVSNFGVEGEAFEYDENGKPVYTDLILKDPNGYGSMAVYAIFTNNNDNPFYYKYERTALTYDNELEAAVYDTWLSNVTSEYYVSIQMTEEETTAYNSYASDLMTTYAEKITKFITGDLPLEDWDSFIAELYDLGLEEMQAIQQAAFDRSSAA